MKPSELLKKGWCQGAIARNADGYGTLQCSEDAVEHCLVGAAYALGQDPENERRRSFLSHCRLLMPEHYTLDAWNDAPGRTQSEVVALAERVEKEMGL